MDKQQLEAIRARDADYNDIFEEQARMSPDIAHRLVAWPVADRRALLAAYDVLLAAVRKVTCYQCENEGSIPVRGQWKDCPDCADLRRILEGER